MLLGRRLPRTEGRLAVPGLQGPVTVRRDGWGVPHIEAQCDHDAWFALGFCHGQDRAFQLEVWLRLTRGTMAELFGKKALHADMLSRTIGFHRAAAKQVGVLDVDVRAQVEAYCAGVNAGATLGLPRRPHELAILRAQPTPWTAADV